MYFIRYQFQHPIASYVHHIHLFLTFVTIFLCDAGDSTVTRWTTASGCISSLIFICLLIPKVFAAVRTIAPQRWSNSLIDQLYPNCLTMLLPLVYCRYTHWFSMCNRQRIVVFEDGNLTCSNRFWQYYFWAVDNKLKCLISIWLGMFPTTRVWFAATLLFTNPN